MSEEKACLNTDREIYREVEGDYYSPSISVTQSGAIQLNVGGLVIGKTITEWHDLISKCQFCGGSMFYGPEGKENHTVGCQSVTTLLSTIRERVEGISELPENHCHHSIGMSSCDYCDGLSDGVDKFLSLLTEIEGEMK